MIIAISAKGDPSSLYICSRRLIHPRALLINVPNEKTTFLVTLCALLVASCNKVRLNRVPCDAIALSLLLPFAYKSLFDAVWELRLTIFSVDQKDLTGCGSSQNPIEVVVTATRSATGLITRFRVRCPFECLDASFLETNKCT